MKHICFEEFFLVLNFSFLLRLKLVLALASDIAKPQPMASSESPRELDGNMRFGKFVISSDHVFYRSSLSAAFVNLRPIVPGHVLVVPKRIVALTEDLTEGEYVDLWQAVRVVQSILKKKCRATAFNVAVQDGLAAGQSVSHVHVHVLPRTEGDFTRNDDVYGELQDWAPCEALALNKPKLDVPEDADRRDRTYAEMAEEASIYRSPL